MPRARAGDSDYRNFADRFLSNDMNVLPVIQGLETLEDVATMQAELRKRNIDDYRLKATHERAKELQER